MLAGLARTLRAAGHDVRLAPPGAPDRELTQLAMAEDRTLLTRDRRLAHDRPAAARVLVLPHDADAQAAALAEALGLDWLAAPFTRCMLDNALLEPATAAEVEALPPAPRAGAGPFRRCPACGRVYWPGSHVRRMRAELQRLSEAAHLNGG